MKHKLKKLVLLFIILNINVLLFANTYEKPKVNSTSPETEVDSSLKKILGTILQVTNSIYIKILATVSLIYISEKLIISQDKRKFLHDVYGWIIACILINLTPLIINRTMQIKENISELQTFSLFNTPSYNNKY